jgi:hypothetical protein
MRKGDDRECVMGICGVCSEVFVMFKRYNNFITGLGRPWGFQEVEATRFHEGGSVCQS